MTDPIRVGRLIIVWVGGSHGLLHNSVRAYFWQIKLSEVKSVQVTEISFWCILNYGWFCHIFVFIEKLVFIHLCAAGIYLFCQDFKRHHALTKLHIPSCNSPVRRNYGVGLPWENKSRCSGLFQCLKWLEFKFEQKARTFICLEMSLMACLFFCRS